MASWYPGDFETIEYLIKRANGARPQQIGWYCEEQALSCALAQQHRNKIEMQRKLLRSAIKRNARILCLAAGGAPDLRDLECELETSGSRVILNDVDNAALAFCKTSLKRCESKVSYACGNVLRSCGNLAEQGPYDLVIAGGLFDYLPDRLASFLLRQIRSTHDLLAEGATLWFSNVAAGNPFRCWIEYLADWHLIERSESDLLRLLESAGFGLGGATFETDTTRLAHLVTVTEL